MHRSSNADGLSPRAVSPWELQCSLARFVEDYNHRRYHESLQNVTPADVYHGRRPAILACREQIKLRTLQARRKRDSEDAAQRGTTAESVSYDRTSVDRIGLMTYTGCFYSSWSTVVQ